MKPRISHQKRDSRALRCQMTSKFSFLCPGCCETPLSSRHLAVPKRFLKSRWVSFKTKDKHPGPRLQPPTLQKVGQCLSHLTWKLMVAANSESLQLNKYSRNPWPLFFIKNHHNLAIPSFIGGLTLWFRVGSKHHIQKSFIKKTCWKVEIPEFPVWIGFKCASLQRKKTRALIQMRPESVDKSWKNAKHETDNLVELWNPESAKYWKSRRKKQKNRQRKKQKIQTKTKNQQTTTWKYKPIKKKQPKRLY